MAKRKAKSSVPYVFLGSARDQTLRFYEQYDADFLFNKAATLLFVIAKGEPIVEQIEAEVLAMGGGKLSPKYLESLRAELFFTALHECEAFFALLIALSLPL